MTRSKEREKSPVPFREQLEADKRASTLQVLFKVARLVDELALTRVQAAEDAPRLRRSHMSLLPHIELDGTRMSDLAERLGISKQAVSQLVDDMEGFGVIARVPDPDDARARRVVFTQRGLDGFSRGLEVLRVLEQELGAAIGERKMEQLRSALLALQDVLVE